MFVNDVEGLMENVIVLTLVMSREAWTGWACCRGDDVGYTGRAEWQDWTGSINGRHRGNSFGWVGGRRCRLGFCRWLLVLDRLYGWFGSNSAVVVFGSRSCVNWGWLHPMSAKKEEKKEERNKRQTPKESCSDIAISHLREGAVEVRAVVIVT